MRRIITGLLSGLLVIALAGPAAACRITLTAVPAEKLAVGDVVTIEALIYKEHRRCELPDDAVELELSESLRLLDETGWQAKGALELRNTLTLEVVAETEAEAEATVRVFRECSKKGLSETILILEIE